MKKVYCSQLFAYYCSLILWEVQGDVCNSVGRIHRFLTCPKHYATVLQLSERYDEGSIPDSRDSFLTLWIMQSISKWAINQSKMIQPGLL